MDVSSEIILILNRASERIRLGTPDHSSDVSDLLHATLDAQRALILVEESRSFWAVLDRHVQNWSRSSFFFDTTMFDDERFAKVCEVQHRVLREGGLQDAVSDALLASRWEALQVRLDTPSIPEAIGAAIRRLKAQGETLRSRLTDIPYSRPAAGERTALGRILLGIGGECVAEISSWTVVEPGTMGLSDVGEAIWQRYGIGLILYAASSGEP